MTMVLPSLARRPRLSERKVLGSVAVCLVFLLSVHTVWFRSSSIYAPTLIQDGSVLQELSNETSSLQQDHVGSAAASAASAASASPIKIAHAISLVNCKPGNTQKFLDALVILRHSIHQNSVHVHTDSKYSYQMYAFIHQDGCKDPNLPPFLERLGYKPLVVQTPVLLDEIQDEWYRNHVEEENCCGSKEFIKLYAYTLIDHPIVVHWDLDVAVLKPLDDLYDAMIYGKDSPQGQAARARLRIQRPATQKLPERIDAFFTRDVTSATPWETVQAVQGGFVVTRPGFDHLESYKRFIKEGNYKPGRGPGSGWGGLGYGGFQGAMAYQGVLAYYYDILYKGHHVELNVCRWNQVVADVIWRGPDGMDHLHECRDYPRDGNYTANTPENGQCDDCRILPVEETFTAHYTACKKPWECEIPLPRKPRKPRIAHTYRLQQLTNITTCGKLFHEYFEYRRDIEKQIADASGTQAIVPNGAFHPEYFLGYCQRPGGYRTMEPLPEGFDFKQVYGF